MAVSLHTKAFAMLVGCGLRQVLSTTAVLVAHLEITVGVIHVDVRHESRRAAVLQYVILHIRDANLVFSNVLPFFKTKVNSHHTFPIHLYGAHYYYYSP